MDNIVWSHHDWLVFIVLGGLIGIVQLFMPFPIISLALSGLGLGYAIDKWKEWCQRKGVINSY